MESTRLNANQINELKKVWDHTSEDEAGYIVHPTLSNTVDGSSLLFGHVKQIEKLEILATLPPKPEVDKLISLFFDRKTFPITVARELPSMVACTSSSLTK